MRDGYRIFDAHMHIGNWGEWEMKGREIEPFSDEYTNEFTTKDELRSHMEKYGVDKALIMTHYHPDLEKTFEGNKLALELAEMQNVYAAVFFEPHQENIETVKEQARDENIVALKTSCGGWQRNNYSPESWDEDTEEFMDEIMRFARKEELPIHFHTGKGGSSPRKLFDLIEKYPDNTYHAVHMGGTGGGHMAFVPRLLETLENYDVYFDTCWSRGFAPRWASSELKKRGSLDRMMFATDEPWSDFPSEYNKVKGLETLNKEEKQQVLHDNAAELYLK